MPLHDITTMDAICRVIRRDIVRATTAAKSGHLSSALSAVELMGNLFFGGHLHYDIKDPLYQGNDRVIFSKGHASPLLYALWRVAGVITHKELLAFRSIECPLEGHPSVRFPFVDASTGSLGQGLSMGMGMALYSQRYLREPFHTYVLLGDSELSEGSNWEAIQSAAYYEVSNLTAIVDVNRLGQRGETMMGYDLEGYAQRFSAFGWKTILLSDGHNSKDISHAYAQARQAKKPTVILAKTVKGKGISFVEDREGWHGVALKEDQARRAQAEIDAPDDVVVSISAPPKNVTFTVRTRKSSFRVTTPPRDTAPRSVYGTTAIQLFRNNASLVALDAEVSNSTYSYPIAHDYPDRFFEMFIAEQHMVSTAVGLALRGMHPFVSTFAAFLTRAHDQIRMARYNSITITFIGIHAGVSIGQDGASQMGLEDISMMRSIPDCVVLYPADAVSAQNLIKCAGDFDGISYVRMTRAKVPVLYRQSSTFRIGGSHVLKRNSADLITIVAAGITVHEAMKAHQHLHKLGIRCRVIDAYSIAPLDVTTLVQAHREVGSILVVEDHYAGGGLGEAVSTALSPYGARVHHLCVVGVPHSGKPEDTLKRAGIDSEAIVEKVRDILSNDD